MTNSESKSNSEFFLNSVFCAVNAKYIHTNLAIRSIKKYCESKKCDVNISLYETTINDSMSATLANLYKLDADIYCFSCYLWNISQILLIADDLKKAFAGKKNIKIMFGGPEVSYDDVELMQKYNFIDYIICGEGEVTAFELLSKKKLSEILGLTYRNGNDVIKNQVRLPVERLDDLPFAYDDSIDEYKNKLIYYETSRGCPFRCSYCLSGENSKVRFLSLDRVKQDIMFFVRHNVPLVKLVDRTFNASKKRTKEIFEFIIKNSKTTKFHTELAGDLLTDDILNVLKTAPKHIMQFEIGVQTTNIDTMQAINRAVSWQPLKENIKKLISYGNIHIHLDLIAGLPNEDYNSFKKSFNDVLDLKPHMLQLGFLKLLKGSDIRNQTKKFGMVYKTEAPYEILKNNYISYDEMLVLKNIEYVLDKYYNSGSFAKTMNFLFGKYNNDYFKVFYDIQAYFDKMCIFNKSLSKYQLYDILYECFETLGIDFKECMLYDYLYNVKGHSLPGWCKEDVSKEQLDSYYDFLKNEEIKQKLLPHYYNVPAKKIIKSVHFEKFTYGTLMFDYEMNQVINVTDYITQEENNEE